MLRRSLTVLIKNVLVLRKCHGVGAAIGCYHIIIIYVYFINFFIFYCATWNAAS